MFEGNPQDMIKLTCETLIRLDFVSIDQIFKSRYFLLVNINMIFIGMVSCYKRIEIKIMDNKYNIYNNKRH